MIFKKNKNIVEVRSNYLNKKITMITMDSIWVFAEWICVLLGILGTIWASSFKKYKIHIPFLLWIISAIIGIFLHLFYSYQYGLLVIATISLFISISGLIKSLNPDKEVKDKLSVSFISPTLTFIAFLFSSLGIISFIYFLINDAQLENWFQTQSFEVTATLLNIAGLSFISSLSKYSKWSWFAWITSNIMFTIITYKAGFMGLAFQQITFTLLSLWGIINWFIIKKDKSVE